MTDTSMNLNFVVRTLTELIFKIKRSLSIYRRNGYTADVMRIIEEN